MTERGIYEAAQLLLNKHKAPALYVEDFNTISNIAIQDWTNMRYAQYAISQQLEDDLQNLLRVVRVDSEHPYPMNIVDKYGKRIFSGMEALFINTGTGMYKYEHQEDPSVPIYKTLKYFGYFGLSEYNMVFDLATNVGGYDSLYFQTEENSETGSTPGSSWMDNVEFNEAVRDKELIVGLKGNGVKINSYKHMNVFTDENIPFSFRFSGKYKGRVNITLTDEPIFFKYNPNTGMYDMLEDEGIIRIDDKHLDVLAPPDYQHLVELAVDYRFKNREDCVDWKFKTVSARRLTAERDTEVKSNAYLSPKSNRPYYKVENNFTSNKPMFALELGSDMKPNLVEYTGVQMKYLKVPKKIYLTDDDIELEEDRTINMEFPDYICYELVNRIVTLVLEKTGEPRIQSQPVVSDSNKLSRELTK